MITIWTLCKVGVLHRGQKASWSRERTCSFWIAIVEATHSYILVSSAGLNGCAHKREGQSNDTVLSAWLQASWKDLAGSGSPQVPFQWAVITAEVSSHTPTHTHTRWRTHAFRLGGLRDEWAHWGLGLIKWAVARSWCKEILWWDYQSALDGAGPSSAAGRAHWGSISAAAKCCHFNPNINMLAKLEKEASFTYFTNILMYRGLIAFADVNHHRATCPRSKQGSTKTHCLNRRSWQSI